MTKKFCFSSDLVKFILRKVESELDYIFCEKQLIQMSSSDFSSLKRERFLVWQQFDYDYDLFFSSIPGDQANPRHLSKLDDGRYRANPEEVGLDSIIIEEADIPHYRFDVAKLISFIVKANKLDEERNLTAERLWFAGSKDLSGDRAGVFVALNDSAEDLGKELKGLPNSAGRYVRYIVISPFLQISCQQIKGVLNKINVSHFAFADAFEGNFKFKDGFIFSEAKEDVPGKIKLLGITSGNGRLRRHTVHVDDKEGTLTEESFLVLSRLVLAFKKEKDRFAQVPTLVEEGVFNSDTTHWQKVKRLKDSMSQEFAGYDFDKVFENGQGSYRLVVSEVDYDLADLKKIKGNSKIEAIVKKLPIIRKKKASKTR